MLYKTNLDQVCFLGVQLVIRSTLRFFHYKIFLNTPHYSSTPTKQTWSRLVLNKQLWQIIWPIGNFTSRWSINVAISWILLDTDIEICSYDYTGILVSLCIEYIYLYIPVLTTNDCFLFWGSVVEYKKKTHGCMKFSKEARMVIVLVNR